MIRKRHYIVNEHMPGYLPDGDPGVFGTYKEAVAYAYHLARQLRDEGYRVVGSSHRPAPLVEMAETFYIGHHPAGQLDRYVSIGAVACQGDPCDYCDAQDGR